MESKWTIRSIRENLVLLKNLSKKQKNPFILNNLRELQLFWFNELRKKIELNKKIELRKKLELWN